MSFKDDQLIFRRFKCKKTYEKDFNKDLINRFAKTHTDFVMKTLINLFCY